MLPVIALVGRPNVGKSTLFNRLTRSRDAIVADFPGLTRDRQYGQGRVGRMPYLVVDTGGFEPVKSEGIVKEMANQAELAIDEADVVIFVTDARAGLTPHDQRIAVRLRQSGRKVLLAVNKSEGLSTIHAAEFYELGLGEPLMISAAHGQGINALMELALEGFEEDREEEEPEDPEAPKRLKVTLAGRPNAGKSTLINALIGEERLIAYDMAGTTRDAIKVDFEYGGRAYE
ncbi:ribosome-associated GTPase EngA, partial [gut metagenome]